MVNDKWIEEFDKLSSTFRGQDGWCCVTDNQQGYSIDPVAYYEVKQFIKQLLASQKQEWKEKIEGIKPILKHAGNEYEIGFRDCLEYILQLLEDSK